MKQSEKLRRFENLFRRLFKRRIKQRKTEFDYECEDVISMLKKANSFGSIMRSVEDKEGLRQSLEYHLNLDLDSKGYSFYCFDFEGEIIAVIRKRLSK